MGRERDCNRLRSLEQIAGMPFCEIHLLPIDIRIDLMLVLHVDDGVYIILDVDRKTKFHTDLIQMGISCFY